MREHSRSIILKSLQGARRMALSVPEHSLRKITKFRQKARVATQQQELNLMIPKIIVRNEKSVTVVGRYKLNKNQSAWTLCISEPLYWRLTIQSGECNYITKANCVTEQIFTIPIWDQCLCAKWKEHLTRRFLALLWSFSSGRNNSLICLLTASSRPACYLLPRKLEFETLNVDFEHLVDRAYLICVLIPDTRRVFSIATKAWTHNYRFCCLDETTFPQTFQTKFIKP